MFEDQEGSKVLTRSVKQLARVGLHQPEPDKDMAHTFNLFGLSASIFRADQDDGPENFFRFRFEKRKTTII